MKIYLLDTNHCSAMMDGEVKIAQKLFEPSVLTIVTSVIVQGELIFMAENSENPTINLQRVHNLLQDISVYPLDKQTATIYGRLKGRIFSYFGPREKAKRRHTKLEHLGFGDNDLWIAATAIRYALTVVSADSDFERIQEVEKISFENWL